MNDGDDTNELLKFFNEFLVVDFYYKVIVLLLSCIELDFTLRFGVKCLSLSQKL